MKKYYHFVWELAALSLVGAFFGILILKFIGG